MTSYMEGLIILTVLACAFRTVAVTASVATETLVGIAQARSRASVTSTVCWRGSGSSIGGTLAWAGRAVSIGAGKAAKTLVVLRLAVRIGAAVALCVVTMS